MSWRVILRFSLNKDKNSALRNSIAGALLERGFQRTKTGTWERDDFDSPGKAMRAVREVTRRIQDPHKYGPKTSTVILDHVWVYVDQPRKRGPVA